MDEKELLRTIQQAAREGWTELDLSEKGLTVLPPEIGQLTNLTALNLRVNELTALPPEIGQLSNLRTLDLGSVPDWLRGLEAESGNQLLTLPPDIGQLINLTSLNLSYTQLTVLPPEIGKLSNLTSLDLSYTQLAALPSEIGKLSNLTSLGLKFSQLAALPSEIGKLSNLTSLNLNNNQLTTLPSEIGQLINLTSLHLNDNQLTALPPEIGQLSNLRTLGLGSVPDWLMELESESGNQLLTLPPEIGKLSNLTSLNLNDNQLTTLPLEIGRLINIESLSLQNNPLTSPPPEIVEQGTQAILAYLQELEASLRQWVSKLLVVGEGGVGKTSLLQALRGKPFAHLDTTHGIQIKSLELAHPTETGVTMQLNAWDFGGQEIYHATHQFFLTNRSLFVLAWNARHGYEQGKLYYWLDTIQARAPESPVILVATHIDERDADLPLTDLRAKYPQIVAHCEISNKTGQGIKGLRQTLTDAAAGLPLMGETWPASWLDAANAIRSKSEKYITPRQLGTLMIKHDVIGRNAAILTQWLHELGDILFFQHNPELDDIVVLKPQWVTEYISDVLESDEVIDRSGILTKKHLDALWDDLDSHLRDHFLHLMEQFDLSYRTLEDEEVSLVVERLSFEAPNYTPA